ncbi:hypothetical protein HWV62_4371 [Athelia sp. TMB]|nr:hypothetical protein HWV62_4371 [Athelia sp. TMB]
MAPQDGPNYLGQMLITTHPFSEPVSSSRHSLHLTFSSIITAASCYPDDSRCPYFDFYFNGIGATIYTTGGFFGANVTFSTDGANIVHWTMKPSTYTLTNISAYTVQNLSQNSGEVHHLTGQLNPWQPQGEGPDPIASQFGLDWILVRVNNQPATTSISSYISSSASLTASTSSPAPLATSAVSSASSSIPASVTTASSAPPSASTTSKHNSTGSYSVEVGVIVGAGVGGAVALAAIIAALYCMRRGRRANQLIVFDADSETHSSSLGPQTTEILQIFTPAAPVDLEPLPWLVHDLPLSTKPSQTPFIQLAPLNGAFSEKAPPEPTVLAWQGGSSEAALTPAAPEHAQDEQVELTDEQIDFIRGLGSANVSPEDIARIIDRMRADYAAGRTTESGGMLPDYEALIRS